MAGKKSRQMNLPLLLPLGGLIIEGIVYIVLISYNVKISQSLAFFLILIGGLLAYQVVMQVIQLVKVNVAISKSEKAKELVDSGNGIEAIKEWKKHLQILPRDQYLETLDEMVNAYQKLEMDDGVKAAKDLIKNSHEFFDMVNNAEKATPEARQQWREKSNALRNMVKELPES
jgi:hypothetical protein